MGAPRACCYAASDSPAGFGLPVRAPNSTSSREIREPSTSSTVSRRPSAKTSSPTSGSPSERAEDEPGQRVVVLLVELGAERLVEVVDRVRAVDADALLVESLDRRVGQVELVLDLADDLLEQVLEGDDPVHDAVLVDDDRHVLLLAPEIGEERGEVLGLGDDEGRPGDRLEAHRRDPEVVHRREEIAHVQDADDLVERVPVHGVARVRRVDDGRERLLRRHVGRDRHDIGPWHDHRGDLLRREVEDLVEHLLLGLLELAHVLGGGHAVPDVLARVGDHPCGCGLHPEEREARRSRTSAAPRRAGASSFASQSSGTASAIASTSAF